MKTVGQILAEVQIEKSTLTEEMFIGRFKVSNIADDGSGYVGAIQPPDRSWIIWLSKDGTAEIWTERDAEGGQLNGDPDIILGRKTK